MEVRHNTRVQPITLRNGQRTSVRLDPAFFCALRLIACQRGISMAELIRVIEAQPRPRWRSLASTLRTYAISAMIPYFPVLSQKPHQQGRQRQRATYHGNRVARHGV
jgi:predicted DNA-binding ribbon-helix-helix protein